MGDHLHRLHCRVHRQLLNAPRLHGVDAAILRDIREVAAVLTQLDGADVRRIALFEGED
ncbi:MAG: hypothetical protein AAFP13_04720 [Pseudomonadota bacterium]